MPITTGSAPKALSSPYASVAETGNDREALIDAVQHDFPKANKKPPKIKKHAFGGKQPGAAFRK